MERLNKVAAIVHWDLFKKNNILVSKNWWDHKVKKMIENEQMKILWHFHIQTDEHLVQDPPVLMIVEKKKSRQWMWQYLERREFKKIQ